ncbi:MAG: carboxypeptidase-like regulatory domain-containing protein, partial [Terriglobales bacterium]
MPLRIRTFLAVVFLVLAAVFARGETAPSSVKGVVEDPTGAVIAGARVEFTDGKYRATAQSDATGLFQLEIAATSGTISVRATGFLPLQLAWNREAQITLVLHPQYESDYASQHVLVTATRINT